MPDMYDPILRADAPVTAKAGEKPLPEQRAQLTSQEAELIEARLQAARDVVGRFTRDPSLSHQYSQNSAWRTFVSVAENKLVPSSNLSTRINLTSLALRQIVELISPNRHSGMPFKGEIVRDQMALEMKKAHMVNQLCMAGHALLVDHPARPKSLDDRLRFMQDHVASSTKWIQDTAAAARQLTYSAPRPLKKPQGQQTLFS